jgi:hypothetical protein
VSNHPLLAWEGLNITDVQSVTYIWFKIRNDSWTHIIFIYFNAVLSPDNHELSPVLVAYVACSTVLVLVKRATQSF